MFGSTIIDVVIGLSFIYVLLSLVCASLGEVISGNLLNLRARDLERGVEGLLRDPMLVDQFYEHPVIRSLAVADKRPDYIPSRTFALVLLDVALRDTHYLDIEPEDSYSIRRLIQDLPTDSSASASLRTALLNLCNESGGGLSDLRRAVGRWYDDCMDRVSGAYKRRMQAIIVVAAAAITVAVNADTIGIARGIWNAPFLRETLAEQERISSMREQVIAYGPRLGPTPTATPDYEPRPAPTFSSNINATSSPNITPSPSPTSSGNNAGTTQAPTPSPTSSYYSDMSDRPAGPGQRLTRLADSAGFPLGWSSDYIADNPRGVPTDPVGWMLKLCGWLMTVLVVTFGASIWFDLLNKFTVIRSTVKPREKSRPQPSKDKSPPP